MLTDAGHNLSRNGSLLSLSFFARMLSFEAVQICVNLVESDLEKLCKISIFLQKSASIQLRTSLSRFVI